MATIVMAVGDSTISAEIEQTLLDRGHEVLVALTASAAVDLALRVVPDLVILEADMPGLSGGELARRLRGSAETAGVALLFLTDSPAPQSPPGAVAEADDYLVKPVDPPEVAVRAEALLARGPRANQGRIPTERGRLIAVAGPKGGCGRTTIAVNVALAIAAAHGGGETLLLDGHLAQGDVDVHLDLRSTRGLRDLVLHAGRLDLATLEAVLATHRDGLRILIGARGYGDSEWIAPALWQEILHLALASAETIVVDLGPGYEDERTLATLAAASVALVVLTPEIGSVRNARQLLDLAPQLGLDRSRLRPVLNRAQDHANLNAGAVATALGIPRNSLIVLPEGGPSTVGHINRGMPIVEDRRSKLGRELERLAHSLIPAGRSPAG
jgi:pilus assembly protein CpaE